MSEIAFLSKMACDARIEEVNQLPAQTRATVEETFQTRVKTAATTAFLWEQDSHASLNLSSQNFPDSKPNLVSKFPGNQGKD
jgi:hypothetical protein